MSQLKTRNENKLEELLLGYCKRNNIIASIILLVCLGFAAFLFSYPEHSIIGFILMIVFCSLGFYLFTKLPEEKNITDLDLKFINREEVKDSYQKEKKGYSGLKKSFIILLVIFDLLVPIICSILYYIYDNIQLLNYPLAVSLIITGIILFIWLRRSTRLEALRKLINM